MCKMVLTKGHFHNFIHLIKFFIEMQCIFSNANSCSSHTFIVFDAYTTIFLQLQTNSAHFYIGLKHTKHEESFIGVPNNYYWHHTKNCSGLSLFFCLLTSACPAKKFMFSSRIVGHLLIWCQFSSS